MNEHRHNIFVAGTFDGLHAGHAALLSQAFANGSKVTIGLTSDLFVQKFKVQSSKFKVKGYEERKKALEKWLEEQKKQAMVISIDDRYEPAASIPDLDALIVTAENRKTGERINRLRQGSTLPRLSLIEVPMVTAQDGTPISSTRLRNGEIDRNGKLIMPESLRQELGKPVGKVLKNWIPYGYGDDKIRITVGDIATKTFLDAGIRPTLAIIDGKVGRKPYLDCYSAIFKATPYKGRQINLKSGPGFISREAIKTIQDCFLHSPFSILHSVLFIDGEEDLLVLPAIIHAPIGSLVYYGQPGEGLVEVVVTLEQKHQALALLGKFT